MKKLFSILTFLLFVSSSFALSDNQIQRVEQLKSILGSADTSTIDDIISNLDNNQNAEEQLTIMEVVAQSYSQLVKKYNLSDLEAQSRLLEKVRLNMAYFQLGGINIDTDNGTNLNIVIQRTLLKNLPEDLIENKEIFHSLSE